MNMFFLSDLFFVYSGYYVEGLWVSFILVFLIEMISWNKFLEGKRLYVIVLFFDVNFSNWLLGFLILFLYFDIN